MPALLSDATPATPQAKTCALCGSLPVLTQETRPGSSFVMYDISHTCPSGLVHRGARAMDKAVVIAEWNRQQELVKR